LLVKAKVPDASGKVNVLGDAAETIEPSRVKLLLSLEKLNTTLLPVVAYIEVNGAPLHVLNEVACLRLSAPAVPPIESIFKPLEVKTLLPKSTLVVAPVYGTYPVTTGMSLVRANVPVADGSVYV
jgi:hypothetical protein